MDYSLLHHQLSESRSEEIYFMPEFSYLCDWSRISNAPLSQIYMNFEGHFVFRGRAFQISEEIYFMPEFLYDWSRISYASLSQINMNFEGLFVFKGQVLQRSNMRIFLLFVCSIYELQ